MKKKLISLLLALVMCLPLGGFSSAVSYESVLPLLYFVESDEEITNIQTETHAELYEKIAGEITFASLADLNAYDFSDYYAVAVPESFADRNRLQNALMAGVRVYIYGDFSIQEYKEKVGLDSFHANIEMQNLETGESEAKKLTPDQTKQRNVIGYELNPVRNKGLLANILTDRSEEIAPYEFFTAIGNDYILCRQERLAPMPSSTILEESFDNKVYYDSGNSCVTYDYVVYKIASASTGPKTEFLVKTSAWAKYTGPRRSIKNVKIKNELLRTADNIVDHGPYAGTFCDGVSFSVGASITGPPFSLSMSFSGSRKIECSADYDVDSVEWTFSKGNVSGDVFKSATDWLSTDGTAKIKLSVGATTLLDSATALGGGIDVWSGWDSESIAVS